MCCDEKKLAAYNEREVAKLFKWCKIYGHGINISCIESDEKMIMEINAMEYGTSVNKDFIIEYWITRDSEWYGTETMITTKEKVQIIKLHKSQVMALEEKEWSRFMQLMIL